ncbi:MAG: zinc-ribbon domain-containing protein [Kiritimatiellia bacterium]
MRCEFHPFRPLRVLPFAVFLLAAQLAFCAIRVCPSCSWEVEEQARFCSHCGAAQTRTAGSATPATANPAATPNDFHLDEPASDIHLDFEKDVRAISKSDAAIFSRNARTPAIALAAIRNTLAVLPLAPNAIPSDVAASLRKRETECLAALCITSVQCPMCSGRGKVKPAKPPKNTTGARKAGSTSIKRIESASVEDLNSERQTLETCPFCNGAGAVRASRNRKELDGVIRLAERDFERSALADGRISLQGVFVPRDWDRNLSVRQRSSLARHAPHAGQCETCAGVGTIPCPACDGIGRIVCPNADFHSMKQERQTSNSGGNGKIQRVEDSLISFSGANTLCPQCNRRASLAGSIACSACTGKGIAICPTCTGTRVRNNCRSCNGDGVKPCRSCHGTGTDRRTGEPCAECNATKITTCQSCDGTGYGR